MNIKGAGIVGVSKSDIFNLIFFPRVKGKWCGVAEWEAVNREGFTLYMVSEDTD